MKKTNTSFFFIGLFIGLIIVGGIFAFFQPTPKITYSLTQKFKECIEADGEYNLSDWSLKDDGSDYRVTCKIPEHRLWQIKIKD